MFALRDAASFLTRIPLHRSGASEPNMSAAVPWFGVVGAVLGLVQGCVYVALLEVSTRGLAASLSVALLALITGAFHHDGLADIADAFGGGWTRDQRLEILKDSRLGTYGVMALVLAVAVEISALSALGGWLAVAATVVSHGMSRSVAAVTMIVARPARASGLGVDYLDGLSRAAVLLSAAIIAAGTTVLFGLIAIAILIAAFGAGALVVRLANAKIGGISGDVLGAVQQMAKLATLVAIVVGANLTNDLGMLGGLALA